MSDARKIRYPIFSKLWSRTPQGPGQQNLVLNDDYKSATPTFRLTKRNDGTIDISGPSYSIGNGNLLDTVTDEKMIQ